MDSRNRPAGGGLALPNGATTRRGGQTLRRWGARLLPTIVTLSLMVVTVSAWQPSPTARAFGTYNFDGQRAEHEMVTRAALACPFGGPGPGDCFDPISLDQLAGRANTLGAVGAPDGDDQVVDPVAHCDDADRIDQPGYPQSQSDATRALQACIDHLRDEFRAGRAAAAGLIDDDGTISVEDVALVTPCVFPVGVPGRAKCDTLQALGRVLHGAQDFHAHSNWADESDPSQPIGINNPPGLNLPAPSPMLDLRGAGPVAPPPHFTTGFFKGYAPGADACPGVDGRVTHACLNKDRVLIEPGDGFSLNGVPISGLRNVSDPQTPRGKVNANAAKAVVAAVIETRRQWADFRRSLVEQYGLEKASLMIGALTKDSPIDGIVTVPELTDLPGIPNAPGGSDAPTIPQVPGIPNVPGLPGLPGRP